MDCLNLLLLAFAFLFGLGDCRCECLNKIVLLHSLEDFRIIASPEYPRPYCANADCFWRIVAPDNSSKVYFYADNLDLRDADDQIIFYDKKHNSIADNETESHICTGDELCPLLTTLKTYCVPILVLTLILLGVFVSIVCCKKNKPNHSYFQRQQLGMTGAGKDESDVLTYSH
ncbi:unnamed protein product [Caenorhabditis bovis]|uniref:CUB domain-containing protein n=1 Tax=Caenorhabditis bovis TaxID=2654633 RepID=A0A8S1EBI3_9PELO|nr:unnamed protein product [Caenorhabditis bovis]